MRKIFLAMIACAIFFTEPVLAVQDYDPQHTMSALNMAIVSIHKILTTKSRVVLDQEYDSIINNLSLGNIESDSDMMALYRELMSVISNKRLRESDSKRINEFFDAAEKRRITYALANVQTAELDLRNTQRQIENTNANIQELQAAQDSLKWAWIRNTAISCTSMFFTGNLGIVGKIFGIAKDTSEKFDQNVQLEAQKLNSQRDLENLQNIRERNEILLQNLRSKNDADAKFLQEELKNSQWLLEKQDLQDCEKLQERLLQSSWNLLRQYHLPDSYRLTQKSLENFSQACNQPDAHRRLRMLRMLEDEFSVYPPYWYFRARAAQEAGNPDETIRCFEQFGKVWRPVLRRDPYKIEAEKFSLLQLSKSGKSFDELAPEILQHLQVIREHTPKEDWANNLFAGITFFILGEKNSGRDCVLINTDFGYEREFSSMILDCMERDDLSGTAIQREIRNFELDSLLKTATFTDKNTLTAMADYFENDPNSEQTLEKLSVNSPNPVIFHALQILEISKGSNMNYKRAMNLFEKQNDLKDTIHQAYSEILPLIEKYSQSSNNAKLFAADMCLHGWGVEQDPGKAEKLFTELAQNGNFYAQYVILNGEFSKLRDLKTSPDPEKARELFELGEKYFSGNDYRKAFEYFSQAAELGHTQAMFYLGIMCQYGFYGQKNIPMAREWYQKAAYLGNEFAAQTLRDLKMSPEKTAPDPEKAHGLFELGKKYYSDHDYRKAFEYFSQAAAMGHTQAMIYLGLTINKHSNIFHPLRQWDILKR